jgi:hypothetical protein
LRREGREEGSTSFLKKRSKKLLIMLRLRRLKREATALVIKSFLVLFFKKELLPWFLLMR